MCLIWWLNLQLVCFHTALSRVDQRRKSGRNWMEMLDIYNSCLFGWNTKTYKYHHIFVYLSHLQNKTNFTGWRPRKSFSQQPHTEVDFSPSVNDILHLSCLNNCLDVPGDSLGPGESLGDHHRRSRLTPVTLKPHLLKKEKIFWKKN